MRFLFLPLLAAALVSSAQQQPLPGSVEVPKNLTIPVQLNTTLRAEKAHEGDVVRFNSIEPVLLGKGVVMPQHAKLYGHVLGAAAKQGQTPSWISVVVERAEWNQHTLALHAFIAGQVLPDASALNGAASLENAGGANRPGTGGMQMGKQGPLADPQSAITMARAADDAKWGGETTLPNRSLLQDVKLARHKSGKTFLFSEKHNVKLSSGILFMLQNVPAEGSTPKPAVNPVKPDPGQPPLPYN